MGAMGKKDLASRLRVWEPWEKGFGLQAKSMGAMGKKDLASMVRVWEP